MQLSWWIWALFSASYAAPPEVDALSRRLDAAFESIDATPAQRAALRRVAAASWHDLDTVALPAAQQLARDVIGALSSETVDRLALESARKEAVELFDQTTSELLPRAIEAAEVLTPEQRRRAAGLLQEELGRWLGAPAS